MWSVFEARPLNREGAHAGEGFNRWRIGIAIQGDYNEAKGGRHPNGYSSDAYENERMPDIEALMQLGHLLDYIKNNITGGSLPTIFSHGMGDEKRPTDTHGLAINPGHTDCPGVALVPHVRWFRERFRDLQATPAPPQPEGTPEPEDICSMDSEVAEALGIDQEFCWDVCYGLTPTECDCENGNEYSCFDSCIFNSGSYDPAQCYCDVEGYSNGDCEDTCDINPTAPECLDPCVLDPLACESPPCKIETYDSDIDRKAGENFFYNFKLSNECMNLADVDISYVNAATNETIAVNGVGWPFLSYPIDSEKKSKLGFTNPTPYINGDYTIEVKMPNPETNLYEVADSHTFNVKLIPEVNQGGGHGGDGDLNQQLCSIDSETGNLFANEGIALVHHVYLNGDCTFAQVQYIFQGQPIYNRGGYQIYQLGSNHFALYLSEIIGPNASGTYTIKLADSVIFTEERNFTVNIIPDDPCFFEISVACGNCDDLNDNGICDDLDVDGQEFNDRDGDGLSDEDEIAQGTDPDVADTDGDGLSDGEEIDWGSNPLKVDSDGDGLSDFEEIEMGTEPTNTDSDWDGDPDGSDPDPTDSSINSQSEQEDVDTDGDGINNGDEDDGSYCGFYSDSALYDSDGDGLSDGDECWYSDPMKVDSDGDGVNDYDEHYADTDALDSSDF